MHSEDGGELRNIKSDRTDKHAAGDILIKAVRMEGSSGREHDRHNRSQDRR